MYSQNIIIDASNIHTGGGKTLLNDFIHDALNFHNINFLIWVDYRYQILDKFQNQQNITFHKTPKRSRFVIKFFLQRLAKKDDVIIYFGNIPPFTKSSCRSLLIQSNRFIIEKVKIKDKIFNRMRVAFERILFKLFKNKVDEVIVQSTSMKHLIENFKNNTFVTQIMPFKNFNEDVEIIPIDQRDGFIYVSSDDPHKNHENLLKAWILLSKDKIYPKLFLTLSSKSVFLDYIKEINAKYSLNIEILIDAERQELLKIFSSSKALIFPSLIESYGLPLIEANMLGIDIIASELDCIRDAVDPCETFDPQSPLSISRAVKRYLKINEPKVDIIAPSVFIKYLIK